MSLPYFPVYIGDYLKDTMHLSAEEHGAYLLLIFACATGGGRVPDDDPKLASIARVPPRRWKALRPTIGAFFRIGDGFWVHARVMRELEAASAKSQKAAQSARKRWGTADAMRTHMPTHSEGNANAYANGMPSSSSSVSEPTTEPSSSTEPGPPTRERAREGGAPPAAADAVAVIAAFDAAGAAAYGPELWSGRRPWPGSRDLGTARAMLEAGADPALCRAAFDGLLRSMQARGQDPPRSLAYAKPAVADALAAASGGLPEGRAGGQQHRAVSTDELLAMAERMHLDGTA